MSISNEDTAQNTHKMKECNTADLLVKALSAAINTCRSLALLLSSSNHC